MALSFPLTAAALFELLRVEEVKFSLEFQQETSMRGNGEMLVADLAPAYWTAEITTIPMVHDEAMSIMAKINALGGGVRAFYLYNPVKPYPVGDPDGTNFGTSAPKVATVTDSYNMSLKGFDEDYVITPGDFFSVKFSSPARTYLGQFVEGGTASVSGTISALAVAPALPAGVATDDVIGVIKPTGKFKLVPNSAYPSTISPLHTKISFSARQTFEAD